MLFSVEGPQELMSPCLAPDYSGQWEHAEVIYKLKGQKAGMYYPIPLRIGSVIHYFIALLQQYVVKLFIFVGIACVFFVQGEPIYESCLRKVEKMIYKRVREAEEVKDIDFYAFSYYYDRAVDLGLIGINLI